MNKVRGANPTRDEFGLKIPNDEQLENLKEACALSKMHKLHEVATKSVEKYASEVDEEICLKDLPKDVTQLDGWVGLMKELMHKHHFKASVLLRKVLPRTARMVLSDESNGGTKEHPIHNIREALDKKLVQLLYDCESPGTIERELRDYQRELLEKPTRKQLVNYVFGILGNNAERPQKSVYVDTETENYIISVQLKHDRDGLAKTIGSMYVHPNGSNKQRVMVTPFGKYNLKAEEGDIKLLAKHGIVWWGINPSLRRIQGVDGNNVF